ncbi:MAG TPA: LLM class F420-dependent oxidoreductase, partial [Acidimicrobiia bacterium]|nr:LLM class F420-dependent oxidoreductase [Acidimicrobiia bacterium]
TNEETHFSGEFYELKGALSEPKATQKPHPPIAIGGKGRKRTLRAVARWAQLWDGLMIGPDEWVELREVLEGHCQDVGRDSSEIDCSVHLRYSKDDDVSGLADQAAALFDAGVDIVVFTMGTPFDTSMVEPLADALSK